MTNCAVPSAFAICIFIAIVIQHVELVLPCSIFFIHTVKKDEHAQGK